LDSLIDRYYKQLGGDKAARRYGEDVLGTVSASLLEGKGFRGALADAVKVKSDAPKIKQAAAMLGIKGEQAQKLYETKLKNVKGPFTQKVEEIMQSRNVDRDRATRMALGESGTLGEAFVSYKNKTGMPPTPTDFDAIAEGFTLGALPEDFSTSKPTGTFYIPGEMVIVEMEEGVQKSIKSYKS
jgi:DNA-binding protein Fis